MTTSGESASSARKTDSETLCVRLTHLISFRQKAAKVENDLYTCSASSRVGTRTRADVDLSFGETYRMSATDEDFQIVRLTDFFCNIACNTGRAYAAVLPDPV